MAKQPEIDDEIVTRENIGPRLADSPAFQRKEQQEAPPETDDDDLTVARNQKFLDEILAKIRRGNLFDNSDSSIRLSDLDAKYQLRSFEFKNNLAFVTVSLDAPELKTGAIREQHGEMLAKRDEIYAIAKKLFADGDTYRAWRNELKRLEKKARNSLYGDGKEHTPFTIPRGQRTKVNEKGEPLPHNANAITALQYYFEDEKITVAYDHWKNSVSITSLKKSAFPRESKDFIVKNYINKLVGKFNILFTIDQTKFGLGQLATLNVRHTTLDYFDGLKWDGTKRFAKLLKDIMKVRDDNNGFYLSVITKQLVASVRRVRYPGAKYDMCPLLIANEGFNKSAFIVVLYGRRNVLAEDILDLTTKEQSEKLRNGIWAVELADTLGDEKKSDARKIKAFITRQDDVGRDAYGRVEDVEHIGRTCVYWHTGNNPHLLTSDEGNRRFIPFYLNAKIDVDSLRQERNQIWAEAVELERIGRLKYEAEMLTKNIPVNPNDEVYPDIMLEEQYWSTATTLQDQAKKKTGYEELLSHVLFWPDVFWQKKDGYCRISVFSDDIKARLGVPDFRWNAESQKIARVMKAKVELRQEECDGLSGNVCWFKTDNLKKEGIKVPLNGYSIYLNGDAGLRAYEILRKQKEDWDKELGLI
jgi:virulence-associated protein E